VNALYETEVRHQRTTPVRHEVNARGFCWLVDLDALPTPHWPLDGLARFRAADHLGSPTADLKDNVVAFLAEQGLDLGGGRVLMLAQARQFGHVFNPLSVFWCYHADGRLAGVVAEVHNTYGERHAYLLRTDAAGRARATKQLYVSPFNPVAGEYHLSLPEPTDRLDLTVTLHQPGQRPFVATVRGRRRPATTGWLVLLSLRHPLSTWLVSLRIRLHGIRLWLRRVPVASRPRHQPQPAVQAPPQPRVPPAPPAGTAHPDATRSVAP
jgi:DUF1365 family protein